MKSVQEHPVRLYYEQGIPLSINSDDPKMFDTSLAREYQTLESELGFSRREIQDLILQGIQTSWMPETRKSEMAAEFRTEFASLAVEEA